MVQVAAQADNNFVSLFNVDEAVDALGVKLHEFGVTGVRAERYFGQKADKDIAGAATPSGSIAMPPS